MRATLSSPPLICGARTPDATLTNDIAELRQDSPAIGVGAIPTDMGRAEEVAQLQDTIECCLRLANPPSLHPPAQPVRRHLDAESYEFAWLTRANQHQLQLEALLAQIEIERRGAACN